MLFEILDFPLMFLSRIEAVKRTQVTAPVCLGVFFAGIDAVFSRFQFAYHNKDFEA